MEQLRNIGQICRQHYEKLVLTAALLILAAAVWFLYTASGAEREKIREIPKGFEGRKVKGVQPASLAGFNVAMKQVETPPAVDLAREHLLFNPVQWQSRAGVVMKIKSPDLIGPGAMMVTNIEPLRLWVVYGNASLAGVEPNQSVIGYNIYSTNEFFVRGPNRLLKPFLSDIGTNATPTNKVFFLHEIKGDPKEPTEFVAELREEKEKFSFAPGKPYSRIIGYEADAVYKPSGRHYSNLRKGVAIDIDGQNYKVVDILPNQVVLSDDSNGKQYSVTRVPQ